jgi:hypothetical protein
VPPGSQQRLAGFEHLGAPQIGRKIVMAYCQFLDWLIEQRPVATADRQIDCDAGLTLVADRPEHIARLSPFIVRGPRT